MNRKLTFFDEPPLVFGYNQSAVDPRDGLCLFGPYENFNSYSIQVGVVGTASGIQLYKDYVQKLQSPIYSPRENSTQRPSFPGFEAIYGITWSPKPALETIIKDDALEKCLKLTSLGERTYETASLYLEKMLKVQEEEETKIDIWFVVLPREVWKRCRPQSDDSDMPGGLRERLKKYKEGQKTLFDELNEEYEELLLKYSYYPQFHDQFKARLLQNKFLVPVQLMLEPTLRFREKYRNRPYDDDICAHLAWTQTATMYYKLGKLPWKLNRVRDGVCYLGLVFKRFEHFNSKGFACSAAQMFLDSGDGTVFKGNVGPWKSPNSKEFHLDEQSAYELLDKALNTYFHKMGNHPKEVFIHSRAFFNDDEWRGFQKAVKNHGESISLTGVRIKKSDKVKMYKDRFDAKSEYGNLRGLAWILGDEDDRTEAYLWTNGFIPRLNTSSSMEVPSPLRVNITRGETNIEQVLEDILSLTKLNYNACDYGDGLPVTLRFSDAIGSILTAVDKIDTAVLPFKYYI